MPLGLQGRTAALFLLTVGSSYTSPSPNPPVSSGREPPMPSGPEAPQALLLLARPSLRWAQHPEPLPLLRS